MITSNDPKLTAFGHRPPRCTYYGRTSVESCEISGMFGWDLEKSNMRVNDAANNSIPVGRLVGRSVSQSVRQSVSQSVSQSVVY